MEILGKFHWQMTNLAKSINPRNFHTRPQPHRVWSGVFVPCWAMERLAPSVWSLRCVHDGADTIESRNTCMENMHKSYRFRFLKLSFAKVCYLILVFKPHTFCSQWICTKTNTWGDTRGMCQISAWGQGQWQSTLRSLDETLEMALWMIGDRWWFQISYLGRWSNLTSIFFKWVGSTTN